MLLLLPVIIALGLALARGGSLRPLAALPIRSGGFLVAALAIQILVYLPPLRASTAVVQHGGSIYLAALALALIGALCNWGLGSTVRVATLGLALNLTVIAANGGYMPVNAAAMRATQGERTMRDIADTRHFNNTRLAGPGARLVPLSDVLPLRIPGGPGNVFSVGDILLVAGIAALCYHTARHYPKPRTAVTA